MALNVRTFLLTVLLALGAAIGSAQQVAVSVGSASGAPGATVNVDLNVTSSGGAQPTGLQWKLTPGNGISSVTFAPSAAATAAGKSVSCANNSGAIDCILYGVNSNAISNGAVATATVVISPATAVTSAALTLSGVMASSATGLSIPSTGTNGAVVINQPVLTYALSGTITGGAGATVVLGGAASRTTTADGSGNYSFAGLANGSYTVTPTRAGFTMTPTSRSVTINGANATANFTATQQTWTISGRITGGASATVNLTGAATRTATADANGNYSFTGLVNGSYTVRPTKSGVTISPTSQAVTINNANATANFSATQQVWSISGTITNGAGSTVTLTGAASQTTTADGSGNYTFTGLVNGSYTVTPTKAGFTFTPTNRAVTINGANATASFTATQQTWNISGTITGGSGATVTLTGAASKTTTADASGNYSFTGLANGSYTVTPTKAGFTFTPANRAVTINGANTTANFSATQQTWGISGVVTGGASVTMTLAGPVNLTTTTDANGNYSFAGLTNGSYTLTPSKSGSTFTPVNRTITMNGANQTGINFTATQATQTWTISGTITGGAGSSIALSGAASKTTTADGSGNYSFTALANGTYTVTPTLANKTMTPASRSVTVNGANVAGTNFTASTTTTSVTPEVDVKVSRNYGSSVTSLASPTFSTKSVNELVLALISTDDARERQTVRSVSGGRLNWRLASRTNTQGGTSEIWYAFSAQKLTSISVTATTSSRSEGQITVMSFSNVDTANGGTAAIGAVVSSNAGYGAPTAAMNPTRGGSIVVGVGNDPRSAVARVPVAGQTIEHQFVAANQGTMWVQSVDEPTAGAGVGVTVRDSYPTWSSYNYSLIEVRGSTSLPASSLGITLSDAIDTTQPTDRQAAAGEVLNSSVTLVHPVTYEAADVCSPGGLATLLGKDFTAPAAVSITNAALPTTLNGVKVQVNGQDAKLMLVGAEQINFQCPDLAPGTALDIAVLGEQGKLQRANISIMQSASPALFTTGDSQQAAIQRLEEGSTNGSLRGGERIRLFLSGLGTVAEPVAVGEVTPADHPIAITSTLTTVVNGVEITPIFSGLAPGTVGLYQVDLQLPESLPANTELPVSVKLRTADGREFLSNVATLRISQQSARTRH